MAKMLGRDHLYELVRFGGLKSYLENADHRKLFVGVIETYRTNNKDEDELLDPHFQVEFVKGYILYYGDDVKTLIDKVLDSASNSEKELMVEWIARYYLDVTDGHIK